MSNKLTLTALVLGLMFGVAGFWVAAPAQDKGPFKSPRSTRPLVPTKPQGPAKPLTSDSISSGSPAQLTAPMSAAAVQRALAKKVDLDLTAAPLSEAVAAIKKQTNLEIRVVRNPVHRKRKERASSDADDSTDKANGKSSDKSSDDEDDDDDDKNNSPNKPSDKPIDKPATNPSEKPADKPAEKSAEKPADKATDKATNNAGDKKEADKPVEKPSHKPTDKPTDKPSDKPADKPADKPTDGSGKQTTAAEPKVSVHLKGISAASALNLMLRDIGLSWSIDRGGVLIASPDRLPTTTAVYDVRDLVVAHPGFDNHDDSVDLQYDPLIGVVTGSIQCPAWSGDVDKVQDCNPFHGTLTVRQNQQIQQKVAGLLAALRKARDFSAAEYFLSANLGMSIDGDDNSAIATALEGNVNANFRGAKLEQVADWVRHTCGIPVYVDRAARSGQESQSFTLEASGVSLKTMLRALLSQSHLAYYVADESLVITPRDEAAEFRTIRVYPVGDLIRGETDRHGIDDDYAQLLDSITHNVQPDSWAALDRQKPYAASGNSYAAYLPSGRAIVIDQTGSAHEEIAATLGKLRAAVASQPAVKPLAGDDKPPANQPDAAKRFLSMRVYKLNADLPADDFVTVVHDLVEPKSWTAETYVHGVPGAIVVRQTPAIHKRIERLLIELGAIPDPKKSGTSGTPILIGGHKRA